MLDNNPKVLYHYTNLETLALILENRTIRFMPLSMVDDVQEQMTSDSSNIGDFIFVSCWTDNEVESIPMWNMYASLDTGVRIQLPVSPFETYRLTPEAMGAAIGRPADTIDRRDPNLRSVIPPKDLYNGMYSVECDAGRPFLPHKITYTDDSSRLLPNVVIPVQNGLDLNFSSIGLYKNTYWKFQDEWRYILWTLPISISTHREEMMSHVATTFKKLLAGDLAPKFRYYDLRLSDTAFLQIKVTLSPKLSAGNTLLAESLLDRYGLMSAMEHSTLEGLL